MKLKLIHENRFLNSFKISPKMVYIGVLLFLLAFVIVILPHSFASLQPVKSVEIFSENLNYQNNEPGAWKVTQTARFVSKDKVKLTIDVDSIFADNSKNMDVIFVLDKSISMLSENKLNKAIESLKKVINERLLLKENKVALLSFDDNYNILTEFTNNKDVLDNKLNSMIPGGSSSYYQALVGIDKLLQNYIHEINRECAVVFLIGSLPSKDTPNEKGFYNYLKNKYPFINIRALQYGLSTSAIKSIEDISDSTFISFDNLKDDIFQSLEISESYSNFSLTNIIDSNYFKIESVSSKNGDLKIDSDSNSLVWNIPLYRTGSKATIEIDLLEKDTNDSDYYILNNLLEVNSKIADSSERIVTENGPILKDNYQVKYDGNFPDGCSSKELPATETKKIFDTVGITDVKLKCDGYNFKGWRLKTTSVTIINDDYFIMPEENVSFVAEWSKTSLKKSADGTIYKHIPPVLQAVNRSYSGEIWAYKDSITRIIIQDEISNITGAIQSYDISEKKDGKVIGVLVSNANTNTYTAYIQGDGKIMANTNSSYLFYNFSNLTSINGLENLDTSNVVNMGSMFSGCLKIASLDCSTFKTPNVIYMGELFSNCRELMYINISKFDTSRVTSMVSMFYNCIKLTSLNLTNFDTKNVTNMSFMFTADSNSGLAMALSSINVSSFNTSKVTTMRCMFANCNNLTSLNLINFNTSKVEDMGYMFINSYNLAYLNLSSFNTEKVKDMVAMFCGCHNLPSLNLSEFVIGDVSDLSYMFHHCYKLTANITIKGNNIKNYYATFNNSTGSNITVNYTSANSALVDNIIATKTAGCNIVKGRMVAA